MTRRLPFTQAELRTAIAAARKEGLRVRGIRPDGTIMVDEGGPEIDGPVDVAANLAPDDTKHESKWTRVKA